MNNGFKQIAIGLNHAVGISFATDSLFAWGSNDHLQLGITPETFDSKNDKVTTLESFRTKHLAKSDNTKLNEYHELMQKA